MEKITAYYIIRFFQLDYSYYLRRTNPNTFFTSPTSLDEVKDLQDLKTNKTTGPNSLPNKIIKQVKNVISSPLSEQINKSFSKGVIPPALKIAEVVPVFKSESSVQCNNYRLASALPNVSNVIEKMMHKRLTLIWVGGRGVNFTPHPLLVST